MPDEQRKPLTYLPDDTPRDLRDFLRCRTDSVTIAPGRIDWLPGLPDLDLDFEEGPGEWITLRLSGGFINISVPVTVVDGNLVADTSKIPVPGDAAGKWIANLNADLRAGPNPSQFAGVSTKDGKLHLSKKRLVTSTGTDSVATPSVPPVVQPPLDPPPPPSHVTDPVPPPQVVQPPLDPAPPPTHVTDPIPGREPQAASSDSPWSHPDAVEGEGEGQHRRFSPEEHHHVPDLSETELPTGGAAISNEAMLELFNPGMTAEMLEEDQRNAISDEEFDSWGEPESPDDTTSNSGSGFLSNLPMSRNAVWIGGASTVLIVLAVWWALAGGGTPSEDPKTAVPAADGAVAVQSTDGVEEPSSVNENETPQVPAGMDPRAHILSVEPVTTADGTQGLIVIFTEPWTGFPNLYSFFVQLVTTAGDCSSTLLNEGHAGTRTTPVPWLLLDDGSSFIDTGCDVNPNAPIEIGIRSGSMENSDSQPVFGEQAFTIDPSAVANAQPFDTSRVVENLGAAPIPTQLAGFDISGASNDGNGKIAINFKGPVQHLVEGDSHTVDIRAQASEGGIRVVATLRNIGGKLVPNGNTINDADEVDGSISGVRVDTTWEWASDSQLVVTMVSTEDVPIPTTEPNVTVTVVDNDSGNEFTFSN